MTFYAYSDLIVFLHGDCGSGRCPQNTDVKLLQLSEALENSCGYAHSANRCPTEAEQLMYFPQLLISCKIALGFA